MLRQRKGLAKLMDGVLNKNMQAEAGKPANRKTHLEAL
jgi:hypothetical protein